MVQRLGHLVFAILLAGGCGGADFQPLNRTTLRASQPRSIVAANSPLRKFEVGSSVPAGWVVFGPAFMAGAGLVDAADASRTEAVLERGDPLADPALRIRALLLEGMAKRFALRVVNSGTDVAGAASPSALAAQYARVDLVLDVRTSDWGLRSFGAGNYGVSYDGTLTLVDGRTRTILAQGICVSHPVTLSDGPSRKKLTEDGAALVRQTVDAVTFECAEDYRKRVLGLY